jgi:hypothetical protein
LPGCCDAVGSVGNGDVELAGRQGLEKANAGAGVGLAAVADGDGEVPHARGGTGTGAEIEQLESVDRDVQIDR